MHHHQFFEQPWFNICIFWANFPVSWTTTPTIFASPWLPSSCKKVTKSKRFLSGLGFSCKVNIWFYQKWFDENICTRKKKCLVSVSHQCIPTEKGRNCEKPQKSGWKAARWPRNTSSLTAGAAVIIVHTDAHKHRWNGTQEILCFGAKWKELHGNFVGNFLTLYFAPDMRWRLTNKWNVWHCYGSRDAPNHQLQSQPFPYGVRWGKQWTWPDRSHQMAWHIMFIYDDLIWLIVPHGLAYHSWPLLLLFVAATTRAASQFVRFSSSILTCVLWPLK